MKRGFFATIAKMILLFLCATLLFYICLHILTVEYKQKRRYELPEGPSIKVHQTNE